MLYPFLNTNVTREEGKKSVPVGENGKGRLTGLLLSVTTTLKYRKEQEEYNCGCSDLVTSPV